MITRKFALTDLDRHSSGELTKKEIENKYEMTVQALIDLTHWTPTTTPTEVPTAVAAETVIDVSTKDGRETLAAQAVTAIIELLEPLDQHQRWRVLNSVGAYFGVDLGSV